MNICRRLPRAVRKIKALQRVGFSGLDDRPLVGNAKEVVHQTLGTLAIAHRLHAGILSQAALCQRLVKVAEGH